MLSLGKAARRVAYSIVAAARPPHRTYASRCISLAMRNFFAHDGREARRPRIQRSSHLGQILRVIIVFARDRSRRVVQDALDDFIRHAHLAEMGGDGPTEIVGVEWLLNAGRQKPLSPSNQGPSPSMRRPVWSPSCATPASASAKRRGSVKGASRMGSCDPRPSPWRSVSTGQAPRRASA